MGSVAEDDGDEEGDRGGAAMPEGPWPVAK